MKIEQKEAVFSPVVITLETQEEVDQMYSLVYWNTIENEDQSIDFEIEKHLSEKVKSSYPLYTPANQKVTQLKRSQ